MNSARHEDERKMRMGLFEPIDKRNVDTRLTFPPTGISLAAGETEGSVHADGQPFTSRSTTSARR